MNRIGLVIIIACCICIFEIRSFDQFSLPIFINNKSRLSEQQLLELNGIYLNYFSKHSTKTVQKDLYKNKVFLDSFLTDVNKRLKAFEQQTIDIESNTLIAYPVELKFPIPHLKGVVISDGKRRLCFPCINNEETPEYGFINENDFPANLKEKEDSWNVMYNAFNRTDEEKRIEECNTKRDLFFAAKKVCPDTIRIILSKKYQEFKRNKGEFSRKNPNLWHEYFNYNSFYKNNRDMLSNVFKKYKISSKLDSIKIISNCSNKHGWKTWKGTSKSKINEFYNNCINQKSKRVKMDDCAKCQKFITGLPIETFKIEKVFGDVVKLIMDERVLQSKKIELSEKQKKICRNYKSILESGHSCKFFKKSFEDKNCGKVECTDNDKLQKIELFF